MHTSRERFIRRLSLEADYILISLQRKPINLIPFNWLFLNANNYSVSILYTLTDLVCARERVCVNEVCRQTFSGLVVAKANSSPPIRSRTPRQHDEYCARALTHDLVKWLQAGEGLLYLITVAEMMAGCGGFVLTKCQQHTVGSTDNRGLHISQS